MYSSTFGQNVASSAAAASPATAAGVEGGIAVRKDATAGSMYNYLVNTKGLPVLIDLTGKFTGTGTIWQTSTPSTGSAKCDAYIWAKENGCSHIIMTASNLASEMYDKVCNLYQRMGMELFETSFIQEIK